MPAQKRFKTGYSGVYYIQGKGVTGSSHKIEKIFYITYRKNGKLISEKAGRQFQDDMTAAKSSGIRARRLEGKELSNKARRLEEEARKQAEAGKWTIGRLWAEYQKDRKANKSLHTDQGRYERYLKSHFENKEPKDILPLDVDRLRIKLSKGLSPQSVKHVLNLLTWIINFGTKKGLCPGLPFHVKKPKVHNEKIEDLTSEQLARLLNAIKEDSHPQAGPMMLMALYTGLRRSELFKLKWDNVDFERGFILVRDPKGGLDQKIPLNDAARTLLESRIKTDSSDYVFPGRGGKQRVDINHAVNQIKTAAGLPKDFRPLHGLRHVYASMLASSGQVDMYTLQKLLTHKDPRMTQRYAHLRDDALKKASDLAGDIISNAASRDTNKVVSMENKEF
ncbi:Integrase [uncultured Desulfobacterium sp.]|uniref:Integrase n=1 Tax=uncultured Desulfobacterium sp. TaxID=201089 RepID=A0A445MRD3_9BACT|nr:Integrase [uncultured Desulfobacterium sp.]